MVNGIIPLFLFGFAADAAAHEGPCGGKNGSGYEYYSEGLSGFLP